MLAVSSPNESQQLLCKCMRLTRDDICSAARTCGATLEAVQAATGAGGLCGGCKPKISAALVQIEKVEKKPSVTTSMSPTPGFRFDADALEALRGVPEVAYMAIASVFAATGERFMI